MEDFKNYLKYKGKEMIIEGLVVWLKIEEANEKSNNRIGNQIPQAMEITRMQTSSRVATIVLVR